MSGYFEEQLQKRATEVTRQRSENQGSTAQFGKKPQPGFLPRFRVWKTKEYSVYFSFFKLKKWGKKTAAARRHNCAVLP